MARTDLIRNTLNNHRHLQQDMATLYQFSIRFQFGNFKNMCRGCDNDNQMKKSLI